jgi:hypothetical protein
MSSENLISLALTQSILNANATAQSSSQTNSSFSSSSSSSSSLLGLFNQSSISHMDELVKEYLLFRGFNATFKAFEHDLKQDKDRSFRADKITDQLLQYIYSHDLTNLIDYWSYLDQRYFSRISLKVSASNTTALTRKYELFLFRFYLIHAFQTGKLDKVMDFFENYANKLQSQNEWRDWYCLPFLKNPDENPVFAVYFNKSWTETFIVSLQNFLNIVFQSLPFPRLLNYDEESYWNKRQQSNKKSDLFPNVIFLKFVQNI